jgi:hypothetical protein
MLKPKHVPALSVTQKHCAVGVCDDRTNWRREGMDYSPSPASHSKLELGGDFVDVGPFRKMQRSVLERNASVIVHD